MNQDNNIKPFEEQKSFRITAKEQQLFKKKCLIQPETIKKPSFFERFGDIEEIVRNNIRLSKQKNMLIQTAQERNEVDQNDKCNLFNRKALKILKLPLRDDKQVVQQLSRINQTNISFYPSNNTTPFTSNHSISNGLVNSEFTTPVGTPQITNRSNSQKNQNSNMNSTTYRSNFGDSNMQYFNIKHIPRSLNNSISHRTVSSVGQYGNNQEINMKKQQQKGLQLQTQLLSSLDRQNSIKTPKNQSLNSSENKHSYPYQQSNVQSRNELTSLKSSLISEIDADKIILLRDGGNSKSNHLNNFYLQMISNEKLTSPEYPCNINELISKEEEGIDEKGKGQQEFICKRSQNKKQQLKDEQIQMDDGSVLKVHKVRSASESISQQQRLELHNSQNMNFKKSEKRKDIMLLSEWLDRMVNELYGSCQNIKQYSVFYGKLEKIFDGAIHELARQIQLDCSERAQFLRKIWNLYCSLVEEVIQRSQETNIRIEKVHKDKLNQIHSNYLSDLAEAEVSLKIKEEKMEMNENYMNKLRSENRYLRKKWRKVEQSNEIIKQDFEQILSEREELVKENQILKMKIEGILMSIQQQNIETQFERDEQTDKFRDEIERIRNEQLQHFSQLFNEQKAKLDETYNIRDVHKNKELLLTQKIEDEVKKLNQYLFQLTLLITLNELDYYFNQKKDQDLEKNRLNVPHVDSDAFDNIVLDNKCVDTHDLFLTQSIGVDTSNLKTYESVEIQVTPITIQTTSKYVQVSKKTSSQETQADLKLNVFQLGTVESNVKLNKINNHFNDYISQQYQINLTRFTQIDEEILSEEVYLFLSGLSAVMNGLLIKQEFSQKDIQEIFKYVELNVAAVQLGICKIYCQIDDGNAYKKRLEIALRQTEMEMVRIKIQARLKEIHTKELLKCSQNKQESQIVDNCRIQKNQQSELIPIIVSEQPQVLIQIYEQSQSSPNKNNILVHSKIDSEQNNKFILDQQAVDVINTRDFMKYPSRDDKIGYSESQQEPKIEKQEFPQMPKNTQQPENFLSSEEDILNTKIQQLDICNEESESDDYSNEIINLPINNTQEQKQVIFKEESKISSIEFDHQKEDINVISTIPVIKVNSSSKQFSQSSSQEVSVIQSLNYLCLPNTEGNIEKVKKHKYHSLFYFDNFEIDQSRRRSSVMTQIIESIKAENQFSSSNMISRPSWKQKSAAMIGLEGQGNEIIVSKLLRDQGIIKKVDNIFNRLRVPRKSGKTTKKATLIIERLIREQKQQELKDIQQEKSGAGGSNDDASRIRYLQENKIPGLLKIFSQIFTELFKFIKKNKNLSIPHFHVFTFEYCLNMYGYTEVTEKRYWRILKVCLETKLIDKRIKLYLQLLIGEIDYIDYKFLLEIFEKIDETEQSGIGVSMKLSEITPCYISWQKVYELFVGYFGQTIEGSQLYEYEKELCSMKIKMSQGSRVCIDLIDTIELLMKIYNNHIKIRSTGSVMELYSAIDCYGMEFVTVEQFQNVVKVFSDTGNGSLFTDKELLRIFFDEADLVLDRKIGEIIIPELFQEVQDFIPTIDTRNVSKESTAGVFVNITGGKKLDLFIPQQQKALKILIKQHRETLKIDGHAIYGISQLRFSQICIDYNIFSSSKQNEFLGEFPGNQYVLCSNKLIQNQIENIQLRLMTAQYYCLDNHIQIKLLTAYFQKKNQNEKNKQPEELFFQGGQLQSQRQAEFALRILEISSKYVYLQALLEIDLLPSEFINLQETFSECLRLRKIHNNK